MTTFKTPTKAPAFDRRDFRQTYTELHPETQLTLEMLTAEATPSFPVLGDIVVSSLVEAVTIERIQAMGADPLRLSVPFQSMAERTARAMGLENVPLPQGVWARLMLWHRVLVAGNKLAEG